MRKKDANPYKPVKTLDPPFFLSKSQLGDFYDEFTLLDRQVSVKRIVQAMSAQNYSKTDKMVHKFFEDLKHRELDSEKNADAAIAFDKYFEAMMSFFVENNENNEMMVEVLADSETGEISKETVKEALEDALGRTIFPSELVLIMDQLKKDDFFADKVKRTKTIEEADL